MSQLKRRITRLEEGRPVVDAGFGDLTRIERDASIHLLRLSLLTDASNDEERIAARAKISAIEERNWPQALAEASERVEARLIERAAALTAADQRG